MHIMALREYDSIPGLINLDQSSKIYNDLTSQQSLRDDAVIQINIHNNFPPAGKRHIRTTAYFLGLIIMNKFKPS